MNELMRFTKVELAVEFFAVDDVESVWNVRYHVADFEIEPLVMVVRVHIWVQDQIILKLPHLECIPGILSYIV